MQGLAQQRAGRSEDAVACLDEAVKVAPLMGARCERLLREIRATEPAAEQD